eukprot:scaffold1739_cov242-Pinguiococcus_pyrenoidosus.AAC.1
MVDTRAFDSEAVDDASGEINFLFLAPIGAAVKIEKWRRGEGRRWRFVPIPIESWISYISDNLSYINK